MSTLEVFLLAMALMIGLPWLIWRLGRTDFIAPLVVVQMLSGILLGPGALGSVWPEYYQFVFNPAVTGSLNGIAWWAVILFVWMTGLELDFEGVWRERRDCGLTASLALGVPFVAGVGVGGLLLAGSADWLGEAGSGWQFVLGIGMSCAVTALPVLMMLMDKMALTRTVFGQRVLRYASLDDIAIWAVLGLILMEWSRLGRQALFFVAFFFAAWGMRALLRRVSEADRWGVTLIWVALSAFGADWAGVHFMVGAFLAGAVQDRHWFDEARLDAARGFLMLAFLPVYFLMSGLRTDWSVGGASVLLASLLLLLAAVGGKLAGVSLAGRLLGWRPGDATAAGWLLQTKGLVMIIFANVLLDKGIIAADAFTALLLMAVMSTMLTGPMMASRLSALRSSSCITGTVQGAPGAGGVADTMARAGDPPRPH